MMYLKLVSLLHSALTFTVGSEPVLVVTLTSAGIQPALDNLIHTIRWWFAVMVLDVSSFIIVAYRFDTYRCI